MLHSIKSKCLKIHTHKIHTVKDGGKRKGGRYSFYTDIINAGGEYLDCRITTFEESAGLEIFGADHDSLNYIRSELLFGSLCGDEFYIIKSLSEPSSTVCNSYYGTGLKFTPNHASKKAIKYQHIAALNKFDDLLSKNALPPYKRSLTWEEMQDELKEELHTGQLDGCLKFHEKYIDKTKYLQSVICKV